jgi:flagellar biosynthesis/type III secretory pathway protein FliH
MANNEKMSGARIEGAEKLSDNAGELREALRNRMESERNKYDKAGEMENAKHEVERAFEKGHDARGNKTHQSKQSAPPIHHKQPVKKATKTQKKNAYKKTLKSIQKEMNPAERTFSKIIHNPVVEATSEVAGKTVARPAALLAGSLAALILTTVVYITAKYYGYVLSGFEWIATFVLGWAIGLIVDWVRVEVWGRRG